MQRIQGELLKLSQLARTRSRRWPLQRFSSKERQRTLEWLLERERRGKEIRVRTAASAPGTHKPPIAAVHAQANLTHEIVCILTGSPRDRFDVALGCRKRKRADNAPFGDSFLEVNMLNKRPLPPRPDRIRSIRGSFSWIDHRFLRQEFDQGLSRLEKLFYFVLIAVSNCDGVSFYSHECLGEILEIRHAHELTGARNELVARDLIAFKDKIYQVLELPPEPKKY